jgi:arginyl-tRNA synthetase
MLIDNLIKEGIQETLKTQFPNTENLDTLINAIQIELPKNNTFGDLATTAPLNLAKALKKAPMQIATLLKEELQKKLSDYCEIEIAPPGFLNFKLSNKAFAEIVNELNTKALIQQKNNQSSLLIEYVSANPTGDLHLGHGRGAVVGSTIASILKAVGRPVQSEFYINDAGEQMQKLGRSAWNLCSAAEAQEGEEYPRELIEPHVKDLLDKKDFSMSFEELKETVKSRILAKQKEVLSRLNVHFDRWVSEKTDIHEPGLLNEVLAKLKDLNLTYEKEGALWLKSSELGDERDRVLVKSEGGRPTYLAGDLAYHLNKFSRADELLDIFGADHHGQEISLKVALKALGKDKNKFHILFIQFVSLVEQGQEVKMSKRTGSVISVEEVLDKVGADAFRFMLLMSHVNNRLAFDVDIATRTDEQNPVFYVQYAHARACSILRNATTQAPDGTPALTTSEELTDSTLQSESFTSALSEKLSEKEISSTKTLILKLLTFNKEVHLSADSLNPSSLAHFLIEVANNFHSFYTHCRAIDPKDKELSMARLALIQAFQRVLKMGLNLLLVTAPEKM